MNAPKAMKLNAMLKDRFGIEVDFSSDLPYLRAVMEHYSNRRDALLESIGANAPVTSSEYTKSLLIVETIRMYLREIAPRRMRRKAMKK